MLARYIKVGEEPPLRSNEFKKIVTDIAWMEVHHPDPVEGCPGKELLKEVYQ